MTREELLAKLRGMAGPNRDPEAVHLDADLALLAYIDDEEVSKAFEQIEKWYA